MSKRTPDQVVEFRISLQDREREMFDTLIAALTFNRIATPTVDLLKDASALSAVALILESLGVIDVIPDDVVGAIAGGAFDTVEEALDAVKDAIPDLPEVDDVVRLPNPWIPVWTWLKITSRKLF